MPELPGLYAFDEADAELSFLPMAARRALDAASVHLSLEDYRLLALSARVGLVALGAAEAVDARAVRELLATHGKPGRPEAARPEPARDQLPERVLAPLAARSLTLSDAEWRALRALDRYVLDKLAERGRLDKLVRAHTEIMSRPSIGR